MGIVAFGVRNEPKLSDETKAPGRQMWKKMLSHLPSVDEQRPAVPNEF